MCLLHEMCVAEKGRRPTLCMLLYLITSVILAVLRESNIFCIYIDKRLMASAQSCFGNMMLPVINATIIHHTAHYKFNISNWTIILSSNLCSNYLPTEQIQRSGGAGRGAGGPTYGLGEGDDHVVAGGGLGDPADHPLHPVHPNLQLHVTSPWRGPW